MAKKQLLLSILSPEETVLTELAVDEVIIPAAAGRLGVLAGHAPLMARLNAGSIIYKIGDKEESIDVFGGFAEIYEDKVLVLAADATLAEEIKAEEYIQSERGLRDNPSIYGETLDLDEANAALNRTIASLKNLQGLSKTRKK